MPLRHYYSPRSHMSRAWVWVTFIASGIGFVSMGIQTVLPANRIVPVFTLIFFAFTAVAAVAAEVSRDGEPCREWWHPTLK